MAKILRFPQSRPMMATKATHLLGDLSSKEPSLCLVYGADKNNFIGCWAEGFGFGDVKFPKKTTRSLTEKEQRELKGQVLTIGKRVIHQF